MKKRLLAGIAAVSLTLGLAGTAGAQGAEKYPLVGPHPNAWCSDLELWPWSDTSQTIRGFAIINYSADSNTIKATVSVKGLQPNTSYPVRLIQGEPGGGVGMCHTQDGVITTNRNGNGTLNVREVANGSRRAAVYINTEVLYYGMPSWASLGVYTY